MKTLVICNQKGGVGKTTTCLSIGEALRRRGEKVLYIDADAQTNLTFTLEGDTEGTTLLEVLQEPERVKEAIQETAHGDLIAGSEYLSGLDLEDMTALKTALSPIKRSYDRIIIDTPPSLSALMIAGLTASDGALITAQADIYSLQGIGQLVETIDEVKKHNKSLKTLGIVLTRYNGRTKVSKRIEEIARDEGLKILDTKIRECTALKECQYNQTTIFDHAKSSNGAKDYEALLEELIKEGL